MFFAAGPFEACLTNRSLNVVVPEERCVSVGYGSYEAMLDTLEGAISATEYVAGAHFSAADVYVGSHIAWGMQAGTVEKRPAFSAYLQRLSQRPAYQRAAELDNILIAQMRASA
jgi:Glutathione S-transferase